MSCLHRKANTPRSSESGVAMMMALSVVLVLSLITVALVNLALTEYATASTFDTSTQAFLAAESGGERAVALLRADGDWSDNATTGSWASVFSDEPFPNAGSGASQVGTFSVAVRHAVGYDASTNIMVRSVGRVRRSTRAIQFTLHRVTGADFALYTLGSVDTTAISGGGSLTFHGSAYFGTDLTLKAASGAGIFNDRLLFQADAPNYLNHLFVRGNLTFAAGNPTIGSPYWGVHVRGSINGSSNNYDPVNVDAVVPNIPYPNVAGAVRDAIIAPGNLVSQQGSEMRFTACRWNGGGWTSEFAADLNLTGSSATDTFVLPRAGGSCVGYPNNIAAVRAGSNYMLMWDAQSASAQLVFANPGLATYIPGQVLFGRDIVYQGKGTIVVANRPTYVDPGTSGSPLYPQAMNTCAWDLNGNGSCNGGPSSGRTIKASTSPCQGSPGTDNPSRTFPTQDLAAFIVNGRAYSDVNSSACGQEINVAAIVGDSTSTACFESQKKLQLYGFLMTNCLELGEVPDFWQMPDMIANLPEPIRSIVRGIGNPVLPRNWQELF